MRREALAAMSVLALTTLGLGWRVGFHSLPAYFTFWLLCALVGVASVRLARGLFGATSPLDTLVRSGVLAFALVVFGGLVLGTAGLIGTIPYVVFFGACLAGTMLLPGSGRPNGAPVRIPVAIVLVLVPALTFVIAVGLLQSPPTLYDSLSYHLFFPARWLQAHRVSIIATPFSDEAQAYAPANGELFLLWLMVPFHGDLFARLGQLPFYLFDGAVLYALARRAGAAPVHAMYAPALYFLAKRIVEQAVGADVDLICWGMFFAALYIGIAAVDSDARRDWALWGVCAGLYFGSKYVSLVYSPILLLIPLMRGPRLRALWALPGLAVFALPWYLRNWVVGGSPIYPSSLGFAGVTLAQGAYSRAAMANSILHATSLRFLPAMIGLAFGATLFLFWIPLALFGAWGLSSRRSWWPGRFLLAAPVAMTFLYWYGVPDNLDCRFLMPVVMLALLWMPFVFRTNAVWNAVVHGVFAVGLLWLLVGGHGEVPMQPLPWPVGNWLPLEAIVARTSVWLFLGLAGLAIVLRRGRYAVPALAGLVGIGALALAGGWTSWCTPDQCRVFELAPTYIHPAALDAWQWMSEHVRGSTIAYSGTNLPYPLAGSHLANRVYYVNIDQHVAWKFHDYDRLQRNGPDSPRTTPALAVSSGLLRPLATPSARVVDAVRPRYERMDGDRDAWVRNLKTLGVNFVYASILSAYEVDYMWHNADGFPIEDEWARREPAAFTVVYQTGEVEIFAVHLP